MKALEFNIFRMIALMIEDYSFCEAFEKEGFNPDVAHLKVFAENDMVNNKAKQALKRIYKEHIVNGTDEDIEKYNSVEPIVLVKALTADVMIKNIDFAQLKKQKKSLIATIESAPKEVAEDLQGILSLIDSIQDYAVDILDEDENLVFDLDEE